MERWQEGARAGVVLLDAGIVHDIACTMSGEWTPESEADPARREALLAAARIRIFDDRDQYGWYLTATEEARSAAMSYGNADWSVAFIQDVATLDGAPPTDDAVALAKIFREAGIQSSSALTLAWAVLFDRASYVITASPNDMRHQREHDLPGRLEVLDPIEAMARLGVLPGELPAAAPPPGTPLGGGAHWWIIE